MKKLIKKLKKHLALTIVLSVLVLSQAGQGVVLINHRRAIMENSRQLNEVAKAVLGIIQLFFPN